MRRNKQQNTIEGLLERYEALPRSSVHRFTTGPEESRAIGALWDTEVDRTISAFRFTRWTIQHCLDITSTMVLQLDANGNHTREDGSPAPMQSDDRLTELHFNQDAQTLVSMLERRDTYNAQVVHIARYPLDALVVGTLERYVDFDNIHRINNPGEE